MHISEGVLSAGVLAAGWAVTGVGTAVGLKKLGPDNIVRVSMLSSVFFLASLVNVRIGPASTHLSLTAPVGLALGWGAFPAILAALVLQALLFQFGGLLVLGVNAATMAGSAVFTWLLLGRAVKGTSGVANDALSFIAGALGVMLGAFFVCLCLWTTDESFVRAAEVVFAAHVPVAFVEGLVTAFMVSFMRRTGLEL